MTRCPSCSGENPDTQRYCGECGTPLPLTPRPVRPAREADETILLPTADLTPGTVFAHRYQVIEPLGAGGMGQVYRVHDTKVGEEVALKFIRAEAASDRGILERFAQELGKGRKVVHRNVARMFDLNEEGQVPYFTMEYVRGESLKHLLRKVGQLAPGQAIPIACQICAGLEAIHAEGIVHHDLKPQNVMIDEDGRAKILDFGLARPLAAAAGGSRPSRSGTPAYIAPEQVSGLAVDHRADIYSLGIVLYEMLTGRTPFEATSLEDLLVKHARERPRDPRTHNPGLSAELSHVVMKCLEKDPSQRFQSAAEACAALECLKAPLGPGNIWNKIVRWTKKHKLISAAAGAAALALIAAGVWVFSKDSPWITSIAVLPVETQGSDDSFISLAGGLQDKITDALSSIPRLRVIPRDTVDSWDIQGKGYPQIGRILGAKYLLKITVEAQQDRVDARIYLIKARRGSSPPPYKYEKDAPDYRALPDVIARYTAGLLGKKIAEDRLKEMDRRETNDIAAFNLFLEGRAILERRTDEEEIREAIAKYEEAIRIDPEYALAYWGAGNAYENLYYKQEEKDQAVLDKMYFYFNRASEIDPTFAETNLGLGWYYFNKLDNQKACASFKKAMALEPNKAIVNRDTGAFLMSIGLYKQAIRRLSKASKLSPRDTLPLDQIAQCWMYLGECEKALLYLERAIEIDRLDQDAWRMLPLLLILTGRLDEADRAIDNLEERDLSADRIPFLREVVEALRDGRDQGRVLKNGPPGETPGGTYIFLLLGQRDEAIANIQAGIDLGLFNGMYHYSYPSLVKNPRYKEIRDDPRFQAILKNRKAAYLRELKPLEKL